MAELSGFFDAHLVDGEYDRVYLAENFAKYFASFIGNGVFGGKSNELQVCQKETEGMSIEVLSGQAWINGYWYENTDKISLTIDAADGVLNRIDSIVVRLNNLERAIRLAVIKGNPAGSPAAHTVVRSDDYYDLKLADIYIKAGATKITQADISDKRYNTDECGLVMGTVQQLDADEFGIQLDKYISNFIKAHDSWQSSFKQSSLESIDNLIASSRSTIDKVVTDANGKIASFELLGDGVIQNIERDFNVLRNTLQSNVNSFTESSEQTLEQELARFQTSFDNKAFEVDALIEAGEATIEQLNAFDVNARIEKNISDIDELMQDVSDLNEKVNENDGGIGVEDDIDIGCYYVETASGEKEWINPPMKPGVEYRTIERWNGNVVYTQMLYLGALSNKLAMAVTINAEYDKVFFVSGYAFDPENNMSYPFPIILNGLTPAAVISGIEGNGPESNIIINVNEDLSAFNGYINIKYVK